MAGRRILCVWIPRLLAERELRRRGPGPSGLAVVEDLPSGLRLISVDRRAEAEGAWAGMGLADARAVNPRLATVMRDLPSEARLRSALQRWAGRFSPWVSAEAADAAPERAGEGGLALDVTGCAHLFGGEQAMGERMIAELAGMGLAARVGIAPTFRAAWALARYEPVGRRGLRRSGRAVRADAPGTAVRSPAGAAPRERGPAPEAAVAIAEDGRVQSALRLLPVAALGMPAATTAALNKLGLQRIADVVALPRASLLRRFGPGLIRRLEEALEGRGDPVSPAAAPRPWSVSMKLPEPIGLRGDLAAALERLLAALCARLEAEGQGAVRLRLSIRRADGGGQAEEVGVARPMRDPARLAALFDRVLDRFDAGFGVDAVRLEATRVTPLRETQRIGHLDALEADREAASAGGGEAFADLLGRLGTRIGLERLLRFHPAETHIPERASKLVHAAWTEPAPPWRGLRVRRPLVMLEPERVTPIPGHGFRWRGADRRATGAMGAEVLSPEWWLDDPAWRSGTRRYWRIETDRGERLWLFHADGLEDATEGERGGWFVQGIFA